MIDRINNFYVKNIRITPFKTPLTIISIFVLAVCSVLLLPQTNAAIINFLISLKAAKSSAPLNVERWKTIIYSYPAALFVLSLLVLYYTIVKNLSLRKKKIIYFVLIAGILSVITLSTYYYGNNWLDSDVSSELVLGKMLSEENSMLSVNWEYSTEIRLIYQQFFMAPLFKIFTDWHIVRVITVLLNNIILLCSYFFMMKHLKVASKWVKLTALFLILPVNGGYWYVITFGGFYVFFTVMFFCFLGLFFMLREENIKKKTEKIVFAFFCVLSILFGMGGIRAAMDIYVPISITCIFLYLKNKSAKNRYALFLSVLSLVLCGFGYIINTFMHKIYNFHSFQSMELDNLSASFFSKLGNIIFEFVLFFGYTPNSQVLSVNGALGLLSVVLLVCASITIFKLITKRYKAQNTVQDNADTKIFVVSFLVLSAFFHIFLFLFLDGDIGGRYFVPVLILSIPAFAVLFEQTKTFFSPLKSSVFILFFTLILIMQGTIRLSAYNIE
ncbi:MAG: hypothetical protein LBV52_04955, partial [Spirochaetaceae bacterium]|nr:hypothetical protein [Spirochaetaceae bacterium]